jgi:hypothetical protein
VLGVFDFFGRRVVCICVLANKNAARFSGCQAPVLCWAVAANGASLLEPCGVHEHLDVVPVLSDPNGQLASSALASSDPCGGELTERGLCCRRTFFRRVMRARESRRS